MTSQCLLIEGETDDVSMSPIIGRVKVLITY
jgi:hypothetical protein